MTPGFVILLLSLLTYQVSCYRKEEPGLTQLDRKVLLDSHNAIRREAGAADMTKMKWDCHMEQVAQYNLDKNGCKFTPNPMKHEYPYWWFGENMYRGANKGVGDAVETWRYVDEQYRQMVLAGSYQLGCGKCKKAQITIVVCNYGPMKPRSYVWPTTDNARPTPDNAWPLSANARPTPDNAESTSDNARPTSYPRTRGYNSNYNLGGAFKEGRPCSKCVGKCLNKLCLVSGSEDPIPQCAIESKLHRPTPTTLPPKTLPPGYPGSMEMASSADNKAIEWTLLLGAGIVVALCRLT